MSRKPNAHQRRMARIREAFCPDDLVRICELPQSDFDQYAHRVDLPSRATWHGEDTEAFYFYRDTGAPILAVAHLDHVQDDGTCSVIETADGPLALSGALDDRLGAYVILELLPRLGMNVDWLLTTNEEMGASTAEEFDIDKRYNWMIEFDRGGTDVVMYQYETGEYAKLVEDTGARVGVGSYSDIADLDHLGCAGFNWGVGYYDYHSKRSHAWLDDTFKMVSRFMRFYAANASTLLPHYGSRTVVDPCPRCKSELDRWDCCRSCGFGWFELEGVSLNEYLSGTAGIDSVDKQALADYLDGSSGMDEQSAAEA